MNWGFDFILVREPEIQPLVSILFTSRQVVLIRSLFLKRHGVPSCDLLSVEVSQEFPLNEDNDQRQCADAYQDRISAVVIWRIVSSVDLGANQ